MTLPDSNTVQWVRVHVDAENESKSEIKKLRRQFYGWTNKTASLRMLTEVRELLYNERDQGQMFGKKSFLMWQIKVINDEIEERSMEKHPRPVSLIETEKTRKKTLEVRKDDGDNELDQVIIDYDKQLGELGYEYGELIYRIEQYIRSGDVEVGELPAEGGKEKWFILEKPWNEFAKPFRKDIRKSVLKALANNKFTKVRYYHYVAKENKTYWKDKPFMTAFEKGEFEGPPKRENMEVKNGVWVKLKGEHTPTDIRIMIHAQVYENIYRVYNEGARKLIGKKRRFIQLRDQVPVQLRDVSIPTLKERVKSGYVSFSPERNELLSKARYKDEHRILAEWILQIHDDGLKARKKNYLDLKYSEVLSTLYPGYEDIPKTADRIFADATICTVALQRWIEGIGVVEIDRKKDHIRIFL